MSVFVPAFKRVIIIEHLAATDNEFEGCVRGQQVVFEPLHLLMTEEYFVRTIRGIFMGFVVPVVHQEEVDVVVTDFGETPSCSGIP